MAAIEQEANHESTNERIPEPLEFMTQDYIAPENQAVEEREARRWRLLKGSERRQLNRFVKQLERDLIQARFFERYDQMMRILDEFRQARALHEATTWINDESRFASALHLKKLAYQGRKLRAYLREYRQIYRDYAHFRGWLEYEREHRKELQAEDKRERRILKEMRRESKWLEKLLTDVFRKTPGCHHIDHTGEEPKTLVPKFDRVVIKPDAHWFYISASKRTLVGWKFKLPPGVTIDRLQDPDVLHQLKAATKRQVSAVWTDSNQLVYRISRLDSPDGLPREVRWTKAMQYFPTKRAFRFPYSIGVTEDRKFRWLDLVEHPHVLVAGRSTSGKSTLVNGIIATTVSTHPPDEVRLVLIDMKGGLEFTHWADLPHCLWEMVNTVDEVEPTMRRVMLLVKKRFTLLKAIKAKDIDSYNLRVDAPKRLARVIVLIDEMNNFVGLGNLTEEIHNLLAVIVSQGRAVGVHVIAATQHPEVAVIPGRIKTNMAVRLAGSMTDVSASMIVVGSPEAARIPEIPGRFVLSLGLSVTVVQAPLIVDSDIAGVVSAARRAYTDVPDDLHEMHVEQAPLVWDEQRIISYALKYFDGQMSADKLHQMLGEESPGERKLRKLIKSVVREIETVGSVTTNSDGCKWVLVRDRNRYFLQAAPESP